MSYLFSSESVSEGHPDKVADQISDAILDQFLAYDSKARCAIESFVTTGQVVIMGEVSSEVYIDLQTIRQSTSSTEIRAVSSVPSTNRVPTSIVVSTMATRKSRVQATRV